MFDKIENSHCLFLTIKSYACFRSFFYLCFRDRDARRLIFEIDSVVLAASLLRAILCGNRGWGNRGGGEGEG